MPVAKINLTSPTVISSVINNPRDYCGPGYIQLVINSGSPNVSIATTGGANGNNAAALKTVAGVALDGVTTAGCWPFGAMPPDIAVIRNSGTFDIDLYIHW